MIAGIILAAGESSRFGKDKLKLSLGSKMVIDWVLEAASKSKLEEILLVVKTGDRELLEIGEKYKATVVFNPDYKRGMSTSLQIALNELNNQKNLNGFCILLGDQPFVTADIINSLVKEFQKGNREIIVPYYEGKQGNPVLFDITWKDDFREITGDVGGRLIIKANPDRVKRIDFSSIAVIFDIDKEEDYIKARAWFKARERGGKKNEI